MLAKVIHNMRLWTILLAVLALSVLCGCMSSDEEYQCPDGTYVTTSDECPPPATTATTLDQVSRAQQCTEMDDGEYKYACYTDVAVEAGDLSICDKIKSNTWWRYCYEKLNMSQILPPEETTTTLSKLEEDSLTTTTTTSTTTIPCGNGVMDPGEECDIGRICEHADGVCTISSTKSKLAVCLYNNTCYWGTQVGVNGVYDLGGCNGCYGRNSTNRCKCLGQIVINSTVADLDHGEGNVMNDTVFAQSGRGDVTPTTSPVMDHKECTGGLCRKVSGKGVDSCTGDSTCRHKVCSGLKCTTILSPGLSECNADTDCKPS
jgi:hypothetical protein